MVLDAYLNGMLVGLKAHCLLWLDKEGIAQGVVGREVVSRFCVGREVLPLRYLLRMGHEVLHRPDVLASNIATVERIFKSKCADAPSFHRSTAQVCSISFKTVAAELDQALPDQH